MLCLSSSNTALLRFSGAGLGKVLVAKDLMEF
jgi:hypothetical protein